MVLIGIRGWTPSGSCLLPSCPSNRFQFVVAVSHIQDMSFCAQCWVCPLQLVVSEWTGLNPTIYLFK
uniref:Uncharacterized protein n=1 Tax=Zea mays TaxID=4577 RepID=C0HG00_MAIZE|nr:unknown [Zea mays]